MSSFESSFASEALNPDGFLVLRPDGGGNEAPDDFVCEYANPAAQALLGDRLEGAAILATRRTWGGLRAAWEMTLSTGLRSEHLIHWETGSGVHTLRFRAARAPEGRLYVWLDAQSRLAVGAARSDQALGTTAEESLRRTSALFQAVMQGSTDAIYTKNLEGQYTRINAAGARLMGRTVEEVVGHTDAELWPDEARASVAHDREVLAFRQTLTYEEAQSGGRVWLSTKGVLRDEQGRVFGLFGISRDITERKRMEEALHQEKARLQQALSAASVALFDLRMPQGLLRWGPGAAALLGQPSLPAEEPLMALLARLPPEDRLAMATRLAPSARLPLKLSLDFRVVGARGELRRLALWGEVHAGDGQEQRLLGVVVDLTQRSLTPPSDMAA
ncbi:PAS/PAC sensor signal transduction histidine kinase [Corallococcus coralloides DSM 2259]|uniref:histidine kinase n=1 Tax=Corallococcus coralloides (strain ATCC 25202 / DSM 2259 / NBRC 100086 / M2) TaxID=1144275 RepID=H8MLF0_CORCM|nr:PAS domain-containing protein [Corallococcus coralloides]AFE08068.1 PAS/PAC sensor signal transduction histidine kinase [Corallococcus coralloides DSM 2259]